MIAAFNKMPVSTNTELVTALRAIVLPLFAVDGGTLYVATASATEVHLHLAGEYSGCPGNNFTERALLAPIVGSVLPKAKLKVTSGLPIPTGALLLGFT